MEKILKNICDAFPKHLSSNMWEWIVFIVLFVLAVLSGIFDKGNKKKKDVLFNILLMPFVVIMLTWFYGIVRVVIALIMKNNVDSVFYGTISLGGLAVIIVIGMIFFVLDRIKERDNKYRRHKYGGSAGANSSSDGATNNMGESTRIFDENNRLFNEQAQRDYDQMNQQQNDFNNWNNNNMF